MTIAVALSETARGKAALHSAATEALLRNEPLAVLHIVGGVERPHHEDHELKVRVGDDLAGFDQLSWSLHTAPEKFDTADAVLELAEEVGATLLVLGSRRRTPIGKLILGSVVQQVLLKSEIPILVVKAR